MMRDKNREEINEHMIKNEEQKFTLEKHLATVQWIQTIAVLIEAILLSKLHLISDNSECIWQVKNALNGNEKCNHLPTIILRI